jgi:hypothetical protein
MESAQLPSIVGAALAAVFGALAALHVFWAVGGITGGGAAVPSRIDGTPLFRPGPVSTLAVAAALSMAAVIVLGRAGMLAPDSRFILYRAGAWAVGAALLLRAVGDFRYVGVFKRERRTRFARMDTRYYTPLCAALGLGALYLAAS